MTESGRCPIVRQIPPTMLTKWRKTKWEWLCRWDIADSNLLITVLNDRSQASKASYTRCCTVVNNLSLKPIDVTSPQRPWISVVVLKINVFQHGDDWERSRPQGPKHVPNFSKTMREMSYACDLVLEMLLILKKSICDLIIRAQILDMTVQENVPRFCTRSICGWDLFQPMGLA